MLSNSKEHLVDTLLKERKRVVKYRDLLLHLKRQLEEVE